MTKRAGPASYVASVLDADALCAVAGANSGDPIEEIEELAPGDVYRLTARAAPRGLAIQDAGSLAEGRGAPVLRASRCDHRVGQDSEAGLPGDRVMLDARLTFLAADGHSVDIMALTVRGAQTKRFLFPMGSLQAGMDYTLVHVAHAEALADDALRLVDVAPFGCAAGTRITRADGSHAPIEALQPQDRILTRDNGAQPVRHVLRQTLRAHGPNAPVVIAADTLGNPGNLILSPHQRLLIYQRGETRLAETAELLCRAGDLAGDDRIFVREGGFVTYCTLVLDTHEMVYAESVAVESLEVGDDTRPRLAEDHARAVEGLSHAPHYGTKAGREIAAAARERLLQSRP